METVTTKFRIVVTFFFFFSFNFSTVPYSIWILIPWPGNEPVPIALEGRVLTAGWPGKVLRGFLLPISFSGSLCHDLLYGLQFSLNVATSFLPIVYHKSPSYSTAPLGMNFPKLCSKSVPLGRATELLVLMGCLSPGAYLCTTAQDPWQGQQLGENDTPAVQAEVYNLWVAAVALHVLLTSPSMRGPVGRKRQWGPRIHALPGLQ